MTLPSLEKKEKNYVKYEPSRIRENDLFEIFFFLLLSPQPTCTETCSVFHPVFFNFFFRGVKFPSFLSLTFFRINSERKSKLKTFFFLLQLHTQEAHVSGKKKHQQFSYAFPAW